MTRMRESSIPARKSAVPSVQLLSTTSTSYSAGSPAWRSSASIAWRSRSTRLYVGRMMLSVGWRIGPSPFMRRVKIPAHRFSRFDVEQARAVPPVDGARSAAIADRRAHGVDARLEAELVAEKLEPPPPRCEHDAVVRHGGTLLAVQRAAVARVIE